MAEIIIAMVRELHERTGLGMMECKKALTTAGDDIEKVIDDMRVADAVKAAKETGNIIAEGSTAVRIAADNKAAVIIEVNSQADFLTLQGDFKGSVTEGLEKTFNEKLTDAALLAEAREEARLALIAKTGESVNIRRLTRVEGDVVGAYLYGHRIGVVVSLKGGNPELAKDIAMHVAANNPWLLSASEIPEETTTKKKEIFLAPNADKIVGKPENIIENIVRGRIGEFFAEASLVEQPLVKNPEVKVSDLAKRAGAEVASFVHYEMGEGVEKAEMSFAAEVATQVVAIKQ